VRCGGVPASWARRIPPVREQSADRGRRRLPPSRRRGARAAAAEVSQPELPSCL
jgi:hypothetical protein